MNDEDFQERLKSIETILICPVETIDVYGYTKEQFNEIIRKIEIAEGYWVDRVAIFKYGIRGTYPYLLDKYSEVFKERL